MSPDRVYSISDALEEAVQAWNTRPSNYFQMNDKRVVVYGMVLMMNRWLGLGRFVVGGLMIFEHSNTRSSSNSTGVAPDYNQTGTVLPVG